MEYRIELAPIPVTDVDRARDFYVEKAGFVLDHDVTVSEAIRFVQLTPPGSACSICLGIGITDMAPGSQRGLQMVVGSADDAFAELTARGLDLEPPVTLAWGRFVYFSDPDGNTWAIQELPLRE
jgi:catechol 2,3-dioxygenase-like lactoylglutathione lyase family enzyme